MPLGDKNQEKDDFWDLDKLVPKKSGARLSPFVTKPTVSDYKIDIVDNTSDNAKESDKMSEERKLTVSAQRTFTYEDDDVYYPENSLINSVTIKRYKEKYDFYDGFRKSAVLYYDCPGEKCEFAQFYSYMPQYSQLNKAQKNYYFYWRSEMRQGRYIKTDYSYLYLFVYEIINLPDVIKPEDGIKLLCRLWREYRKLLPRINNYFSIWVRDYCLVHKLECPMDEISDFIFDVIRASDFKEFYFASAGSTGKEAVWPLIAYLSDYDWHRGFCSVVGEDNKDPDYIRRADTYKALLEGAMSLILPCVWESCMRDKNFGLLVKKTHTAFPNTLCTHSVKCKLEIEYYPMADASELRLGITAAVRYAENKLRALYGAKSRLSVKNIPTEYKDIIDGYFDNIIRKSEAKAKKRDLPEYEKLYDAPREKLSFAGADEIERLSWNTTMRLCDTDEYVEDTATFADDGFDFERANSSIISSRDGEFAIDNITDMHAADGNKDAENTEKTQEFNNYGLSRSDIDYISTLLESSGCGARGIDDEATVERINEAFSDGFGDVIIEDNGEGFVIIEDYEEEIREWLKNI